MVVGRSTLAVIDILEDQSAQRALEVVRAVQTLQDVNGHLRRALDGRHPSAVCDPDRQFLHNFNQSGLDILLDARPAEQFRRVHAEEDVFVDEFFDGHVHEAIHDAGDLADRQLVSQNKPLQRLWRNVRDDVAGGGGGGGAL